MGGMFRPPLSLAPIVALLAVLAALAIPGASGDETSPSPDPASRRFAINGHEILLEERHDRSAGTVHVRMLMDGTAILPERTTSRTAALHGLYGPFQPPSKQFTVFAFAAGDQSLLIVIRFDGASIVVGGRAGAFDPYERTFVHDPGFGLKGFSVLDLGTMLDTQVNHDQDDIHGWFWRRGMLHILTCRPDDPGEQDCATLLALKPERPRDTGKRTSLCPWEHRDGVGCIDRYTGYATATAGSRLFPDLDRP